MKKLRDKARVEEWWKSLPCLNPDTLRCWWCGNSFDGFTHSLQVHHILGGALRTDHEWNLFLAGASCHADIEDRKVETFNGVLARKGRFDPRWSDREALMAFKRGPGYIPPDPEMDAAKHEPEF